MKASTKVLYSGSDLVSFSVDSSLGFVLRQQISGFVMLLAQFWTGQSLVFGLLVSNSSLTGSRPLTGTQGSATQDPHIAASDSSSDFDVMEGYPMQQHLESSSQDMHALGQQPGVSMFSHLKETLSRATRSKHATNEINEGDGEVDSPFTSQIDPVLSESVHVSTPATTPIGLSKLTPSETLLPDGRSLTEVQEVERYILAAREKEIESLRKAEQRRATLAKALMTSANPLQSPELTTLKSQPIGNHIASGSKDTPNASILDGVFLDENWEYNLQTEKLTDLYTSYTYHVDWLDVIQATSNSTSVDKQQWMICDIIHSIVQMERQNLGINMPSMGPMRFLDTTKAKQPTISQMETPSMSPMDPSYIVLPGVSMQSEPTHGSFSFPDLVHPSLGDLPTPTMNMTGGAPSTSLASTTPLHTSVAPMPIPASKVTIQRMSYPGSSPEVEEVEEVEEEEEEVEEVEDEYDGNEEEHFNVGEESEDVIDEGVDGEGDVEEDAKLEGLDLDMGDEDGDGYQDQDEIEGMGYENELQEHNEVALQLRGDADARVPLDVAVAEVCNADEGNMNEKVIGKDTLAVQNEEAGAPPTETHMEREPEESKDDPLSRPEHGSEVFVGNISKDTLEEDLKELCTSFGDIFEVRVMRDKDRGANVNKGFAFVTFTNKDFAQRAIETLNDCELKGRKLRFSSSQLKNKLFIGNIPKNWVKEELEKTLSEKGPGLQNIELLKDPQNPERNRGFAFVEYYNHACAEHSQRILSAPGFKLGTNTPTINWADSPSVSDLSGSSQVKVVYVRNLPESATQEQLWKLFEHHGEITKVMLPQSKAGQPKRDFGFIHFADRSSALKAIEKSEKYVLDGRELETSLAKPPGEKRAGAAAMPSPFGSGILPQALPARGGFGLPGPNMYGGMAMGFGANRGFGQVQPVIYGRGPTPAGMAMVPMMLPDGRVGYVLQQAGTAISPAVGAYNREDRGSGRGPQVQKQSGGSSSRRYHPY
ncbi:hypothetical protein L7F22_054326 [Adiantum nelumboides]|nr:hypothetical protein [Adiantum nelumboides]